MGIRQQANRNPGRVAACLLLLACAPLFAGRYVAQPFASPPNPVGAGARAMGMGNAFIAVADDATSASWNPGGLTQIERLELSLAVEAIGRTNQLSSATHPEANGASTLRLRDLNYASVAAPFWLGGKNCVASLNYLAMYSFNSDIGLPLKTASGPARVDMAYAVEQEGGFAVLSPALACDLISKSLTLGAAVYVWNHDVTGSSAYAAEHLSVGTLTRGARQGQFQELVRDRFQITSGLSLALGAMFRPSEAWTFGAVWKPPFTLHLAHDATESYKQTGALGTADTHTSRTTDADLEFPAVAGLGAAWRPAEPWTVSADLTWTDWSRYRRKENGTSVNPVTGRSGDSLQDTFTCRVGAEYLLFGDTVVVPLRCGAAYDPAPAVDGVDEFYSLSLGTGLQLDPFMLDVAYEFRWGADVNQSGLQGVDAEEDVRRHRVLASLIYYF